MGCGSLNKNVYCLHTTFTIYILRFNGICSSFFNCRLLYLLLGRGQALYNPVSMHFNDRKTNNKRNEFLTSAKFTHQLTILSEAAKDGVCIRTVVDGGSVDEQRARPAKVQHNCPKRSDAMR